MSPVTVVLQPADPEAPVSGPAGELLQPVTVKDHPIRLRPPTRSAIEAEKGYITISFYEAGRRRNTSGGQTLDEALVTVQEIIDRLTSGAVNAPKTMGDLIERYLDPARPTDSGGSWSAKHRYNQQRLSRLYVTPHIGPVRCKDMTRSDVQRCVDAAPTKGEGQRVRVLMGSILRFGIDEEFISQPLEKLMKKVRWQSLGRPTPAPTPRRQGASALFIAPSKIPELDDIYELAFQLRQEERAPWWWEMLPIFTAFTGMRIAEVIGLAASDVERAPSRRVYVHRQFLEINQSFSLPKGNKTRFTRYPAVTPAGKHFPEGYPLAEMIARRKAEVEKELRELPPDSSPEERDGLLFPAPRGGPWSQSNLSRRLLRPAALRAGWQVDERDRLHWAWHSLRHFFATYQLQDKNIPAAFVSDAMGHANVSITINLYQNIADNSWERLG